MHAKIIEKTWLTDNKMRINQVAEESEECNCPTRTKMPYEFGENGWRII